LFGVEPGRSIEGARTPEKKVIIAIAIAGKALKSPT
jgi:hypothetical protein